jgi:putative toxin-antitoxin system antitoxin component (TIGR02293 family)
MAISHTIAESIPAEAAEQATLKSAAEMWHYKKLVARAVDVFGDEIKASRWLSTPNADLDNQTPIAIAQRNGYDSQVLETILLRIEHGIYY